MNDQGCLRTGVEGMLGEQMPLAEDGLREVVPSPPQRPRELGGGELFISEGIGN